MNLVSKLRMKNMFPVSGSGIGTAKVDLSGPDPLHEVINVYKDLMRDQEPAMESPMHPMQLQRVANINKEKELSPEKPMNVRMGTVEGMTDYQRASLALRDRAQKDLSANRDSNRELAERRISIADFKSKNPNKRFIAVKGGNIMAFNPITGEQEDTGVSSGSLTDRERAELEQENQLERIDERHKDATELEGTRQGNRMTLEEARAKSRKEMETTRQGNRVALAEVQDKYRDDNPTAINKMRERVLKAQEYIARNPDMARYVEIDGNTVYINPGSGFFGKGLSQDKINSIVDEIYGKEEIQDEGNANVNTPNMPSNTPTPPTVNTGRISVIGPGGKKGTVPVGTKLPDGWTEVK